MLESSDQIDCGQVRNFKKFPEQFQRVPGSFVMLALKTGFEDYDFSVTLRLVELHRAIQSGRAWGRNLEWRSL
jgi:hypothetical protein